MQRIADLAAFIFFTQSVPTYERSGSLRELCKAARALCPPNAAEFIIQAGRKQRWHRITPFSNSSLKNFGISTSLHE
jgi:hypothetical protein